VSGRKNRAMWVLLDVSRDGREIVIELGTQLNDRSDDRDRNAGGYQAVFNGGSTGLVLQKGNNFTHLLYTFLNFGDAHILFHNF
jgi:hypothetical protein